MKRQLFISDIHGCANTFIKLLKSIKLTKKDHLILVGDYINRGPHSKEVLDQIMQLVDSEYQVSVLRGNHEEMLLSAYKMETFYGLPEKLSTEFKNSFGIRSVTEIPKKYIDFCESMLYYLEDKSFIAVHGGLNFDLEKPLENKHDMLWIRKWYGNMNYKWLGKKVIIHGHTPQAKTKIDDQLDQLSNGQVINIDNGAAFHNHQEEGLGRLCCFDLTNQKVYFQANCDHQPPKPQKKTKADQKA